VIYPDYPIAQALKIQYESSLKEFENYLKRLLFFPTENIIEASQHRLFILSKSEESLEIQIQTLNEIFSSAILNSTPQVRYLRKGQSLFEPIMQLRVTVSNQHVESVTQELLRREATIFDKYKNRNCHVLRAEGPLRKLIGYKKGMNVITNYSAHCLSWLDRYSLWRTN
jgi:translation elongation factor EF-G